jgi:hypothetical protein
MIKMDKTPVTLRPLAAALQAADALARAAAAPFISKITGLNLYQP